MPTRRRPEDVGVGGGPEAAASIVTSPDHRIGLAALILAGGLCACSPEPAPPAAAPGAAPPTPAATPAAAPARHAHMICRSSRDGRPVPCGTSDAMMVGIKED